MYTRQPLLSMDKTEVILSANPHFYDYIHCMKLENGLSEKEEWDEVILLDGAGQCIQMNKTGEYRVKDNIIYFRFNIGKANVVEFSVCYKLEFLTTVFQNEICWNSMVENLPFSFYTRRYLFDKDPISILYDYLDNNTRDENLYHIIEGDKEDDINIKTYYSGLDLERKNLKDMAPEELEYVRKMYTETYDLFISRPKDRLSDIRNNANFD
jgi:hypothetical protein